MNVEAVDLVGFVLRVWEPWSRISGPWNQAFLGRFGKSSESSKPLNGPVGNACEGVILETLLLLLRIPFWMRATWLGFVNDLCFPECVAKGSCFLGRGSRGDVLFAARSLIASRYAYKNCCAMWHFKVAKRHSVASVGLRGTQARSVACCSNQPSSPWLQESLQSVSFCRCEMSVPEAWDFMAFTREMLCGSVVAWLAVPIASAAKRVVLKVWHVVSHKWVCGTQACNDAERYRRCAYDDCCKPWSFEDVKCHFWWQALFFVALRREMVRRALNRVIAVPIAIAAARGV